jgi:hypothetical protein
MTSPSLKEFARTKGLNFQRLGIASAYASMINTGHRRAGADAIAALAAALGETPERIAAICDQCWQAGEARRAAAAAQPMSPPASSALQEA